MLISSPTQILSQWIDDRERMDPKNVMKENKNPKGIIDSILGRRTVRAAQNKVSSPVLPLVSPSK